MSLAADHAKWFVELVRPLLESFMEHGYKHGWDKAIEYERVKHLEKIRRCEKKCKD